MPMSETTEAPEGTPAPEPTPAPAPESTAPEADAPEQALEDGEPRSRLDRRVATITAKLSAAERLQAKQAEELAYWRQQAAQGGQAQETPEQRIARIEREADARAEERLLRRRFHEEGHTQYHDWAQKTKDLIDMGADGEIAKLLIAMPGGVRVAAALAEDPAELQRIANIEGERGRAIALGRYAATVDSGNGHQRDAAPPPVTRAPAPIRPVTGRAAPQFNEYTADGQTLVERYMRQDMEKRIRR